MSTQGTAPTHFLEANGVRLAYRLIGEPSVRHPPVLFLNHFRSTIDLWDPEVVNPIAATRQVITYDYAGIGQSGGEVRANFREFARDVVALLEALLPSLPGRVDKVDILGFSMGGFVAQLVALQAPNLVGRLVLSGTGAPGSFGKFAARPMADVRVAMTSDPSFVPGILAGFFPPFINAAPAAEAWITRAIASRQAVAGKGGEPPMAQFTAGEALRRLTVALLDWDSDSETFGRLGNITHEVLVTAGQSDVIVPTDTAYGLAQALPRANMVVYPGSGHGHLFQYAAFYTRQVVSFLDGEWPVPPPAADQTQAVPAA